MWFHDPSKPIATCVSDSCDDCKVKSAIHCHFEAKDYVHFLAICLPSFLLGGAGIYHVSEWWLALWIAMIPGFFGLLEIRVLCSHCPHYAEADKSLKCWANYGAPKIWKYRPGPLSFAEKSILLSGFAVIWGYPLVFLILGAQWFLLLVYAVASAGFFMTLKLFLCTQCMNFACPLNGVPDSVRASFFECNPSVSRAWNAPREVVGAVAGSLVGVEVLVEAPAAHQVNYVVPDRFSLLSKTVPLQPLHKQPVGVDPYRTAPVVGCIQVIAPQAVIRNGKAAVIMHRAKAG
jgi:hypothetical protein